jgi:hypothetical protein
MKTLKYEEVLRNEYRDLSEARASIHEFLEKIYNKKRLHSALGCLPPAKGAGARPLFNPISFGSRLWYARTPSEPRPPFNKDW